MIGIPSGRALLRCLPFFVFASAQAASSPRPSVREYLHTSWTESAGQPLPEFLTMTQTADGYLWLASGGGNLRFDGLRFSEWRFDPGAELPAGLPKRVATSMDGSVWVASNGLSRVRHGSVRAYPMQIAPIVDAMFQGPEGRVWLLFNEPSTVWSLDPDSGESRQLGPSDGLPPGRLRSLAWADSAFWLGGDPGVCHWQPGSRADCRQLPSAVVGMSVADPVVYASTSTAIYRVSPDRIEPLLDRPPAGAILPNRLLLDRSGKLWVGTSRGLVIVDRGVVETYTREDGLSGEFIEALLEDAEGDVWVATNNGLDRFRAPRVLHLTSRDGLANELVNAVQATRDGSVWIAAVGHELSRIVNGKVVRYSPAQGLPPTTSMTLHEDVHGRLWVGSGHYLTYFEDGRFIAPLGETPMGQINAIASNAAGIWIAAGGVWRLADGAARPAETDLPADIFRALPDRDGILWLASYRSGVLKLTGGDRPVVAPLPKLGAAIGAPRDLLQDPSGNLWVAFGATLSRLRHGRITTWDAARGLDAGEIAGLADDGGGNLWVAGARAVTRIPFAELNRSPDGQPLPLATFSILPQDGFRPRTLPGMGHPRITAAPDGRIWLCERDGVGVLDPELLRGNTVPPPVVIEDAAIDGVPLRGPSLRFRGRQFQITYTGNSLMAPERVRFRYRLEPGDATWTEAEGRRDVTFVGLSPGSYRFLVTACNLDQVCNERGASLAFEVMPFFYQTFWFRLASVAALGGIAFGVYRLRLRQVVKRFQLVAQERARVTREIHDSLLQGFAGVVFQLDAASRQFDSNPAASKDRLNRALDQADNSLREARQMLLDMRLPILEDKTISEALHEVGADATRGTPIGFHVRTRGAENDLPYAVQAALFLIGREAITNAVNHASPKNVTLHVIANDKSVRLLVQDDGAGFDLEAARRKAGHLGVTGMGERARQVGAELKIDTAPGAGTRLEVIVPRKRS